MGVSLHVRSVAGGLIHRPRVGLAVSVVAAKPFPREGRWCTQGPISAAVGSGTCDAPASDGCRAARHQVPSLTPMLTQSYNPKKFVE
jgi:hypothetical protein